MITLDIQGKHHGDQQVLGPVSLQVPAGHCAAVLGPSGIGKSTLLRIVAGLDGDFQGRVQTQGRLAVVFQEPALLKWRTARDNITLMTGASPARAEALLRDLGLGDKADHFPGQLSLGQQRRLSVARALAAEPQVLLLDEPFASLDADLTAGMLRDMTQLIRDRGITCLLVTHSLSEARAMADCLYRLEGTPARLVPMPQAVSDPVSDRRRDHA